MELRSMTMDDADFMLSLKNDSDTRMFAIEALYEIKKEDHLKYLKKNLKYFHVIEQGNNLWGAVRIMDDEISIWIDKKYRGNGLATFIINQVSEKGNVCKIVDGNIASFRAFINAGFKPIKHENNYYVLQK